MERQRHVREAEPCPAPSLNSHEVTEELHRTLRAPTFKPPMLPGVALEVMQVVSDPDAQFGEVSKVLELDPLLAGRVLSIAQSAAYSTRAPVLSLQQAAIRLGIKTIRDIVVQASLQTVVFRVPGFTDLMARLYRHSSATAHVTRALCRRTGVYSEYAFLTGLLHDMGFAAALLAISQNPNWKRIPLQNFHQALDAVHSDASGLLAQSWKLPLPIERFVANHHDIEVDGKPDPARAVLVVSEQLCWEAGAGMLEPPPGADPYAVETPQSPLEGLDVNWPNVLDDSLQLLRLDSVSLSSLRLEAFEIVERLGN